MATYSSPTYDSSSYQASRPRYQRTLVDTILARHREGNPAAATDLAVDVATGTGLFARQLPAHFGRVVAADISPTMIKGAPEDARVEYVVSPAEDMAFLDAGSVDVLTAATGAHWFDDEAFVREARRVLKPTGTLAIFGYTGFAHFVDYPQCDSMLKEFGSSSSKLGDYWDKGRERLVDGYRNYHRILARDSWTGIRRRINAAAIDDCPPAECPVEVVPGSAVMDFETTWRTLRGYLLTWSGLHKYHAKYPERENLAEVAIREMMAAAGATDMDEVLNIQWEEVVLTCHPPQAN
ncbi:trans-aconitate methyltransferase 1 [Coemansia javaensis]|uniref:Trans-aconitate methyltransferase 1 n=1 Tax=Coemansia javaensis TaxID=2761396 RepID=A0A9W8H4J0_9FUNG|nr:trans-aconitate methyltransferase 1 [Coemansia javaensis]